MATLNVSVPPAVLLQNRHQVPFDPAMPILPRDRTGTRTNRKGYTMPMAEQPMVAASSMFDAARRRVQPIAWNVEKIRGVLDWFNVERNLRYLKNERGGTYCDQYGSDLVFGLTGIWVPQLRWKPGMEELGENDDPFDADSSAKAVYGTNTIELGANAIAEYMDKMSGAGTVPVPNPYSRIYRTDRLAQNGQERLAVEAAVVSEVNRLGTVALVAARNVKGGAGHISVVVPNAVLPSAASNQIVQSQAGGTNKKLFVRRWWDSSTFPVVTFTVFTSTPPMASTTVTKIL